MTKDLLLQKRADLWQQLAQNVANAHALMAAIEVLDQLLAETPKEPVS